MGHTHKMSKKAQTLKFLNFLGPQVVGQWVAHDIYHKLEAIGHCLHKLDVFWCNSNSLVMDCSQVG